MRTEWEGVLFERDDAKARSNVTKHGVSFREAATAFGDPRGLTNADPLHSREEDRWVTSGYSDRGRLLTVITADRGLRTRIISARLETAHERRLYESA